jgi:hypothetical protein
MLLSSAIACPDTPGRAGRERIPAMGALPLTAYRGPTTAFAPESHGAREFSASEGEVDESRWAA